MTTEIKEMSTRDLWEGLQNRGLDMMKDSYEKGVNFSRFLEHLSPTDKGDSLDAFSRVMKEAGIITSTDPVAGYYASNASDAFAPRGKTEGETRARKLLLTEFFARTWRRTVHTRTPYLSTDTVAGSWLRPYADAQTPRWSQQIAPAIPLAELVAMTTPIAAGDYRSFYMTVSAEELRKFRVGEGGTIPTAKLQSTENVIKLKKFGRALEASYEELRRMRVDRLAYQIGLMAIQSEVDKLAAALDVIINGDGNSNSATSYNLTTLDAAATAGTLTLKGWLAFKLKFANPYMMTTAIMQEAVALQLQLLNMGSANIPYVQVANQGILGGLVPINKTADNVRFGWTSDAPTLKIVALDARMSLEEVVEIGGEITEMERYIGNQTQKLTMTEVAGFAVLDKYAANILDVNA